jgi:hypothetical protein
LALEGLLEVLLFLIGKVSLGEFLLLVVRRLELNLLVVAVVEQGILALEPEQTVALEVEEVVIMLRNPVD